MYGGQYFNFKPSTVFDRDGWRCRACHRSTPPELRGTFEDRAPELDHVVPLSKGGDHSMENTQCLCRACNMKKGARTMAEFTGTI